MATAATDHLDGRTRELLEAFGGPVGTPDQLAGYLGVCVETVLRLSRRGRLPHLRVGRLIRFRAREVAASLHEQQRRARNGRAG